jgi:hypothetical protein
VLYEFDPRTGATTEIFMLVLNALSPSVGAAPVGSGGSAARPIRLAAHSLSASMCTATPQNATTQTISPISNASADTVRTQH